MKNPLISIITVSYNSEKYIEETINSVLSQDYKNIEYLIIDGASTDSTIDIIKKYEHRITYWQSEPDKNMYDAINKGLSKSKGDFILILNSDDLLASNNAISNAVDLFDDESDGFYGNIVKLYEHKEVRIKLFQVDFKQLLLSEHSTFIPHPTLFVSRSTLSRVPAYNLKYRYASDYDYILKLLFSGFVLKHIPSWVTKFRLHKESITASGKINEERIKIIKFYKFDEINVIERYFTYYKGWIKYKLINKLKTR